MDRPRVPSAQCRPVAVCQSPSESAAAGNDPTPVRAERRRLDAREVSSQQVRESAGGGHHDARVVVVAGGDHEPAAPAELGIPDSLRWPTIRWSSVRVRLPEAGEVVAARRQAKASVGTEGHSSDSASVPKDVELPAGGDLPQPRRLVVAPVATSLPSGLKSTAWTGPPFRRTCSSRPVGHAPDASGRIVAPGHQQPPVRTRSRPRRRGRRVGGHAAPGRSPRSRYRRSNPRSRSLRVPVRAERSRPDRAALAQDPKLRRLFQSQMRAVPSLLAETTRARRG